MTKTIELWKREHQISYDTKKWYYFYDLKYDILVLSIILYITSSIGWENTSRVQWEFKMKNGDAKLSFYQCGSRMSLSK